MYTLLQEDQKILMSILAKTVDTAGEYFDQQVTMPPGRFIADIPMEEIPTQGIGAEATLDLFKNKFADKITNSAGARYFGFVTGGSTPAAIAGDWLVSAYDQNACGSNDSIAPQIERQTIHFFKQLFQLPEEFFGSFVTGATMSNFVGLALGRQWVGEQLGFDISQTGIDHAAPIHVLSGTAHSSIYKSMAMLGIGRQSLVKIETLSGREAVDVDALEKQLASLNKPVVVVANAGTVNSVDFDNLLAIGTLKSKYPFWLHVDAAFGGFAACSEKFAHLMDGIHHADSVTVDAHKWLNVPYDAAMQFTRHKSLQLKVFQNSAAYLGDPAESPDFFHYTPENSRRFRALPSWFTLMAYGREGYREIVERNCDAAQYFGTQLTRSSMFKLLAPVNMNVVCFTLEGDPDFHAIKQFLQEIRDDGRVFFTPTVYKGTPAIRAAISNWQTSRSDMEVALEALHDVAQEFPILQRATRS
jgi:glutamate/tyrosine decarboxylase-like PLP-dependent enzyme